MKRADLIMQAVSAELECIRDDLNSREQLRSLTITVKLSEAGIPRTVLVNSQTERDLRSIRSSIK